MSNWKNFLNKNESPRSSYSASTLDKLMPDIFASIRSRNATGLVTYFWAVMYMTEKQTLRNLFLHFYQHLSCDQVRFSIQPLLFGHI